MNLQKIIQKQEEIIKTQDDQIKLVTGCDVDFDFESYGYNALAISQKLTRLEADLASLKAQEESNNVIPLVLNKFEKDELKALREMQQDSNAFMSNDRFNRLRELADREFGFNMGYDNKYGNLFRTEDGKVVQGGLNAQSHQEESKSASKSAEEILEKRGLYMIEINGHKYSDDLIEAMEEYSQSHQVEMPGDEEIMCYFNNHSQVTQAYIPTMTRSDVLRLVEWLKSKLK